MNPSRTRTFLQLIRLPAVFTVVADIMMGFLFVHRSLAPVGEFLLLLVSSIGLYWGGMALNDVCDVEHDRQFRPQRPIPSAAISHATAWWLAGGLLILGVIAGWLSGVAIDSRHIPAGLLDVSQRWRSGIIATLVLGCIVAYDVGFKSTVLGPFWMGACRAGNVLLGMSTGSVISDYATPLLGFDATQLAVAGGLGVYVAGITWFARSESGAGPPQRTGLCIGMALMILGWVWLGSMTLCSVAQAGRYDIAIPHGRWPWCVAFLGCVVIRRCVMAVRFPSTERVQQAVTQCLMSLIVFDAAICLASRPPWWWSMSIISLLVPAVWLKRKFYIT